MPGSADSEVRDPSLPECSQVADEIQICFAGAGRRPRRVNSNEAARDWRFSFAGCRSDFVGFVGLRAEVFLAGFALHHIDSNIVKKMC